MERCQQIEHSLITRFRRSIWSRFTKALKEYRLVNEGDKIARLYIRREGLDAAR